MSNLDSLQELTVSPNNAARLLDVSRSAIYELMKTGKLPYVFILSDRRIQVEELKRLSREGTKPAAVKPPQ